MSVFLFLTCHQIYWQINFLDLGNAIIINLLCYWISQIQYGMQQDIATCDQILWFAVFQLVVAQAISAGHEDHTSGGDAG